MLIDGNQPADINDLHAIIAALKKVPSNFSKSNSTTPPVAWQKTQDEIQYESRVEDDYKTWKTSGDDEAFKHALDSRRTLANYYLQQGNRLEAAKHFKACGTLCDESGRPEQGINDLKMAATIYMESTNFVELESVVGIWHEAILATLKNSTSALEDLNDRFKDSLVISEEHNEKTSALQKDIDASREQLAATRKLALEAFYKSDISAPTDHPTAQWIGQGEGGISTTAPMGTANIKSCLVLVIHNPETKETLLLHIHRHTSPEAIRKRVDDITSRSSSTLQVSLIGSAFEKESDGFSADQVNDSHGNLKKTMEVLNDYDVNITGVDIFKGLNQPSGFVVTPDPFAITREVPTLGKTNAILADAKNLIEKNSSLPLVFDSRVADQRKPVLLENLKTLKTLSEVGRDKTALESEEEIYEWLRDDQHDSQSTTIFSLPVQVESIGMLVKSHQEQVTSLQNELDNQFHILNSDTKTSALTEEITYDDVNDAIEEFNTHPIYIGDGATALNKPLFDFISQPNHWFIKKEEAGVSRMGIDFSAFKKIAPLPQANARKDHISKQKFVSGNGPHGEPSRKRKIDSPKSDNEAPQQGERSSPKLPKKRKITSKKLKDLLTTEQVSELNDKFGIGKWNVVQSINGVSTGGKAHAVLLSGDKNNEIEAAYFVSKDKRILRNGRETPTILVYVKGNQMPSGVKSEILSSGFASTFKIGAGAQRHSIGR